MMTDIPAAAISVAGSGPGMTSYIILAFVSGFLLATVIFWIVTKQLQKDWHAEYRWLMDGIAQARDDIRNLGIARGLISGNLTKLFNGEK